MKNMTADRAKDALMASENYSRLARIHALRDPGEDAKTKSARIALKLKLLAGFRRDVNTVKERLLPGEWEQLRLFFRRKKDDYPIVMWCIVEDGFILLPNA